MPNVRRKDELGKWRYTLSHHETHQGDHYSAYQVDESMADGDKLTFTFKTPNTDKHIHILINFASKAGCHITIAEGATWVRKAVGDVVTIYNHRRQDPKESGILSNIAQTDFNAGMLMGTDDQSLVNTTIIKADYIFGAANKGGGTSRGTAERVLLKDTQYAIQLETDGGSNAGFIELNWYEHSLYEFVAD